MVKGAIYVIIAAALWGGGGVAGQYLYMHKVMGPFWLVMIRQLVAGFLFLAYAYFIDKENPWEVLKKEPWGMLTFSFLGVLGAQLGFYYTISLCNAATATVLQYTAPALILIWFMFREKRKPEVNEILGLLGAFIGVFLIATHGHLDALAISPAALTVGLLSALSYAFYDIMPVNMLKRHSTATILGLGQFISGASMLFFVNPFRLSSNWTPMAALAFAYLILGATIASFAIYLQGLRLIGPVRASLISCAEPLSSILLVVMLLGVKLTLEDYFGMGCIIMTVILLSLPHTQKSSAKN